jgi:hypothetical protein
VRSAAYQQCSLLRRCGRDFGTAATGGNATLTAEPLVESPRFDPSAEEPPGTVTIRPADSGAASPPIPPPIANQPPREQRGRRRTPWLLVAVVVLLAVGGGTFALVKIVDKPSRTQPANQPPTLAVGATASPTQAASSLPASPEASPSLSPSLPPSPSPSPSVVGIAPGVEPAAPRVQAVLTRYFQGINDHNYAEYASSLTAQGKANQSESSFDSGYATTTDSGMTLTSLTPSGNGGLTATVTFTSRQSPSDSVDDSRCNNWTVNLSLVPNGTGYLITPGQSSYTNC